jgi:hypothetical protein
MEKTLLAFSTIEALLSFVGTTKAVNLSFSSRLLIVRGVFSQDEVIKATEKFGASITN